MEFLKKEWGMHLEERVVIDFLVQNQNVQVVSSSRAYQFLNKKIPNRVHEIEATQLSFKEYEVSRTKTFLLNSKNVSKLLFQNFGEYLHLKKDFKVDLVISIFETFMT